MKPQHSHSAILFPLLSGAAAMHTVFLLFSSPNNPGADHAGFLIWCGCLTLTYSVLTLLLRRPRSIRTVVLTAAGGICLQLVLTLIFAYHPSTAIAWSALLFMWISLYARCCILLLEDGVQPEAVVTTFELSVLVLFFAGFGTTVAVMPPSSLLHSTAGILLNLIAMVRIRSGHTRVDPQSSPSQKGRFLLVLLLAAMGGLAATLCILLTDSASLLLSRFTEWGFSLLRSAANAFDRMLRWLLSLLPEQHMNSALLEEAESQAPGGAADWGSFDTPLLFYAMLGATVLLILAALIWLWRNGGFHLITFRSRTTTQMTRQRPGLRELLLQVWRHFRRAVSFRITYLKMRNTAPGLLVWLEREMRSRHLERKPGETLCAFLLRIQLLLPSCRESLARLADSLDQHYFGIGHTLPADEIAAMRKQLRAELHQHHPEKAADA